MTGIPWTDFQRLPGDVLDPNGTVGERWENNRYQVIKRILRGTEWGAIVHLTIRNADGSRRRDWPEFQRIKNELVGPEYDAVEVYPAESRVVDTVDHYCSDSEVHQLMVARASCSLLSAREAADPA